MPRCLHTASDLCGSLVNASKQIRMMSAALTVVEHLESLGSYGASIEPEELVGRFIGHLRFRKLLSWKERCGNNWPDSSKLLDCHVMALCCSTTYCVSVFCQSTNWEPKQTSILHSNLPMTNAVEEGALQFQQHEKAAF